MIHTKHMEVLLNEREDALLAIQKAQLIKHRAEAVIKEQLIDTRDLDMLSVNWTNLIRGYRIVPKTDRKKG